jgi:hypothetical protein
MTNRSALHRIKEVPGSHVVPVSWLRFVVGSSNCLQANIVVVKRRFALQVTTHYSGFQVLTTVVMKSSVFRCFGETCRVHLRCRRETRQETSVKEVWSKDKFSIEPCLTHFSISYFSNILVDQWVCWSAVWLTHQPWGSMLFWNIGWLFNELYGVMSKKTELLSCAVLQWESVAINTFNNFIMIGKGTNLRFLVINERSVEPQ